MYSFSVDQYPEFTYDGFLDEGTVFYDGTLRTLINELKHVFQFKTEDIEFIESGSMRYPDAQAGLTYDIFDELATYKRHYAFDGKLTLRISLSEDDILNSIKNVNTGNQNFGTVEIKSMKDIKVGIIAKVSDSFALDGLYKRISQKELNIHSSANDVFKANKENRFDKILNISLGAANKKKPYIEYIKVFIKKKPIIYAKY